MESDTLCSFQLKSGLLFYFLLVNFFSCNIYQKFITLLRVIMTVQLTNSENAFPSSNNYTTSYLRRRSCLHTSVLLTFMGMAIITCGVVILVSKGNLIVNNEKNYLSSAISSFFAGGILASGGCAGMIVAWRWKATQDIPDSSYTNEIILLD